MISRIIQRERFVNHAAKKVSVSAAAGVVSPACDQAGVIPVMVGRMRRSGGGHTSTNRSIVTPATTPATAHLGRALKELRRIRLMSVSGAMNSRRCHVEGIKDRDRSMHHGS